MAVWRLIRGLLLGTLGFCWGLLRGLWRQASGEAAYEQDCAAFAATALYCLQHRLHPDEAREMNHKMMKASPARAQLVRSFQIIADSLDIVSKSKKADTARSRLAEVRLQWQESRWKFGYLLNEPQWLEAERYVTESLVELETAWRVNCAQGLADKAASLKTEKAKAKYLDEARVLLEEGLSHVDTDKATLQAVLNRLAA